MGFDLTESELKATRKLHGLDKEGNIEEDIQILKIFNVKGNYLPDKINRMIEPEEVEAINHVLQKLEQDKKKIKELEEHLKKYYDGELYTAKQLKNIEENQKKYFINKQKVKDLIENETINISGFECIAVEDLEELLEEK